MELEPSQQRCAHRPHMLLSLVEQKAIKSSPVELPPSLASYDTVHCLRHCKELFAQEVPCLRVVKYTIRFMIETRFTNSWPPIAEISKFEAMSSPWDHDFETPIRELIPLQAFHVRLHSDTVVDIHKAHI